MPVGAYFADFLCRELKLVVECDGISHDCLVEEDARRDRWFAQQGYRVLRFTNAQVLGDAVGVAEVIRAEVERLRGA